MKIPRVSPYGLIQETLWPNEWLILVSCIMLNCTTRKQVEKVFPLFVKRWPTPGDLLNANSEEIVEVIKPLGFANRRCKNLVEMSRRYVKRDWTHASELPGVGNYAARAWEIFCRGTVGSERPQDHALAVYWDWCVMHGYD